MLIIYRGNHIMADNSISTKHSRFLSRLLRDEAGNMVAMTAAAIIPLIGIVGGAVDMSRGYMAKARLQAACDAGVLAGRKAMATLTYTATEKARADSMFNFNYKPTDFDATNTSFTTSADAQGKVIGTATTRMPNVLMKFFGRETTTINVNCDADLQIPNIDTMMVLDVTGSMSECPNGNACNSNASSKIVGLRGAVRSFYQTLQGSLPGGSNSVLRYGFVPYSSAVNAGDLFSSSPAAHQLPMTQLVDNWTVQSRVANFTTPTTGTWTVDTSAVPETYNQRFDKDLIETRRPFIASSTSGTNISNNDCERWANDNVSFNIGGINLDVMLYPYESSSYSDNFGISEFYIPEASSVWQVAEPTTGNSYTKVTFSRLSGTWNDNSGAITANYQKCDRRITKTRYVRGGGFKFTNWTYRPVSYNVANFKAGNSMSYVSAIDPATATVSVSGTYTPTQLAALPSTSGMTVNNFSWNGCIEERDTVAVSNFAPIPANAEDLDHVNLGTNDATDWRPFLGKLVYDRSNSSNETTTSDYGNPTSFCPSAKIRNLQVMTLADIDAYTPTLVANGNTYHDVGMVWGLRLLSKSGMFSGRNTTAANGGQISRNLIFMTDGVLAPNDSIYGTYGVEYLDKRVTGSLSTPSYDTLHARRFQALCDAARGEGIAVWVIAFGTAITSNLTACADPGRAYQASNTTELNARFQTIANSIADLRLTR
jgi:Flp pilus assembly protein TadG